jgi:hypothetical protein
VIGRFDIPNPSRSSLVGNCLAATTLQGYFILMALDCSDTVPIAVQDFSATWQGTASASPAPGLRDTPACASIANAAAA